MLLWLLLFLFAIAQCFSHPDLLSSTAFPLTAPLGTDTYAENKSVLVAIFGSCNKHDRDQRFWSTITSVGRSLRNRSGPAMDSFIWLGDVVYADTTYGPGIWVSSSIDTMRNKYVTLRSDEHYSAFVENVREASNVADFGSDDYGLKRNVFGVWDDHDMGLNDGGKEYKDKDAVQELFLDFLDVPAHSHRRQRAGVYSAHQVSFSDGSDASLAERFRFALCIILLDARYHRDPILDSRQGDMLGAQQWAWLEGILEKFADKRPGKQECLATLIGSGVQVLSDEKPTEQWGNFPAARDRLLNLIRTTGTQRAIFISGDVHLGEIAVDKTENALRAAGVPLVDVTASGFTHSSGEIPFLAQTFHRLFPSERRVGAYLFRNFGSLQIVYDKDAKGSILERVKLVLRIHDVHNGATVVRHIESLHTLMAETRAPKNAELIHYEDGAYPPTKQWLLWVHQTLLFFLQMHQVLYVLLFFTIFCVVPIIAFVALLSGFWLLRLTLELWSRRMPGSTSDP